MNGVAEILQTGDKAACLGGFGSAIEMIGAEIMIELTADQHVVDCGEDRGSERADRLFGATTGAQTMKLRLEIAGFLARGGPGTLDTGTLDKGRLKPGGSPRLREGRLLRIRTDRRLPWAFSPRA